MLTATAANGVDSDEKDGHEKATARYSWHVRQHTHLRLASMSCRGQRCMLWMAIVRGGGVRPCKVAAFSNGQR